ncbi:ATP-dependent Clp protease ATP-binding subunit [Metamycoplasma sualvi]|uniref:ATP-dependent Clp protease ATP-binding subunit n=1 Tax=Metamycoplasma sualvi TaxID=2125 RepID=UPI00387394D7
MDFNFMPNEQNVDSLKKYGKNLTELASKNKLEPIIGRDDEIRRVIRILSRKTKNNPILVGEPGVGKTAIVEGLAKKIALGDVPENLKDKELIEIDLASMFAGASFQGQFEERIKNLTKQIKESNGKIIIFIDEVHMIVGTGKNSANNAMDVANILKPMLARGEMMLIGATTYDEYKKYIETDAALERRMQKVDVAEPSIEDTITIMRGIKERFESFHSVKIEDSAIVAAAKMSSRFISDRFLPDKAIDLVDEAAATLKTIMNSKPEILEKLEQKKMALEMEKIALSKEKNNADNNEKLNNRIKEIEETLNSINKEIDQVSQKWQSEKQSVEQISSKKYQLEQLKQKLVQYQNESNYEKASELLYKSIPELEEEIKKLENNSKIDQSLVRDSVGENEIAAIVSKWTKIPVAKLVESESKKLLNLENDLNQRVIGQEHATKLVSETILRSKANINDPNRPIGSFIFLGPTGVGKTELAKTLAFSLFDSEKQMIRIDMSEFMEAHSISKLIGSPPGYVGYGEMSQLSDKVRQNPYSVILFDEIEKAHPDVLNILLQILDDGILKDSKGKEINFKNTIIIMTSNIGSNIILENKNAEQKVIQEMQKVFRPEFINRIDEIIVFNPLDEKVIEKIIEKELKKLSSRVLENQDITIKFSPKINEYILKNGYNKIFGARPINRLIKNDIESFIAKKIISHDMKKNETYELTCDKFGKIVMKEDLLN